MERFIVSIVAYRKTPGMLTSRHTCFAFEATNLEEAIKRGTVASLRLYPKLLGWIKHSVYVAPFALSTPETFQLTKDELEVG